MTRYECWSLALTAIYDLLTLGLLLFVAYEALVKPRLGNLAIFFQPKPKDTKQYSFSRQTMDFTIDNRGSELKNITISSNPDFLGWGNLGQSSKVTPKSTSELFQTPIPYLSSGERYAFFWCDMEANIAVLKKPFEIIVEYDNPAFPFPRRQQKIVKVDFSAFEGTYWGLNEKYDIHNVAQELARLREAVEKHSKDSPISSPAQQSAPMDSADAPPLS